MIYENRAARVSENNRYRWSGGELRRYFPPLARGCLVIECAGCDSNVG